MYDTVVLKSPEITEEARLKVLEFCKMYEGVDILTGEIIYEFTRGELDGSYDYRIRIQVDNREWVREIVQKQKVPVGTCCGYTGSMSKFVPVMLQTPIQVDTYFHLKVECSLHKLMMNHNVFGGPVDAKKAITYLVKFIENAMCVSLPDALQWEVLQIDVSKIFKFNDKAICKKIVDNLKNGYYSRRKPQIYDTSVMFAGSTTTCKFYWKGPEFKKHDYKRIQKYINREVDLVWRKVDNFDLIEGKLIRLKRQFDELLEKAMRIIRFECSIKSRKLKDLFQSTAVYVNMLDDRKLEGCMSEELRKIIKEDENMDIVKRSDLVLERLLTLHGTMLGNILFSTWVKLVDFGEAQTRETMAASTFRRHKKILIESGVSWVFVASNRLRNFSIVPDDFSFLSNKYVDDSVAKEVIEKLEQVA